jgi:hypothetical protein
MGEPISLDKLLLDAIDDGSPETNFVYSVGDDDDLLMGDPTIISLDEFQFDGPAPPPLIDDDFVD